MQQQFLERGIGSISATSTKRVLRFLVLLATCQVIASFLFATSARAVDFGWDGGAGDNLWDSFAGPSSNWSPDSVPATPDAIILTAASLAGPVTIDLNGLRFVQQIDANGVNGTYTFTNSGAGVLTLLTPSGDAVITRNSSALTFDVDLAINSAGTVRLNVQPTGGKITVNGDITSSAASGTTTLMPTSSNNSLPVGIELKGVIADGTTKTALSVGFDGNNAHTGTVRLTGTNTYTGTTRVNIGTLEFNSIANIGAGANALGQPSAGDSTILLGSMGNGTNGAALRYIGTDPPGHTSNRVIRLAGDANDSGIIEASGVGPLVLTGGVANPTNGQTLSLGGTNTGDNELAGTIQDPGGGAAGGVTSIVKIGPGKWILSGNSPDLSNVFRSNEGELVVTGMIGGGTGTVAALATLAAGTVTLDGGSVFARGIQNAGTFNFHSGLLNLAGTSSTNGGSFTIGTAGAGQLRLTSGNHSFGGVTLQGTDDTLQINAGTQTFTILNNLNGGTLTHAGGTISMSGGQLTTGAGTLGAVAGTGGITKVGTGTLTLNATNSYTGPTNINQGILKLAPGGLDSFSPSTMVTVTAGATLDLVGSDGEAFGGLAGAGTVITGSGANVVPGSNNASTTYSGQITGAGGLTKNGTGKLTLTAASDYTGATTIAASGGTLEVATGGSITGTNGVTYSTSTTLSVAGGTIDTPGNIRPVANSGVFNFSSGLVKANAIDRTTTSTYISPFNWTGGTLHLLSATAINGSATTASNRPFAGPLTLDDDMELIVDNTFSVTTAGVLNINGGSVTADTIVAGPFSGAGGISFNSGTLRMINDQTFDAARLAALDIDVPLGNNRALVVDGVVTINAPLVLAGGTFSAGSIVNPGNLLLGSGTLNVTNSDLAVADGEILDVTSGMTVDVTSGALNVADGGEFNAINAKLSFSGGITNNGDVNLINTTVNGSMVNGPSGSANFLGANSFAGDLVLSANSQLFIDIAGDQPSEFDVVSVLGNSSATLDGFLNVSLGGGFTPAPGQQFTVFTASSITDNGLTLGGPAAGQFDMFVNSTSVVLQAVSGLSGDFDNDGDVDGRDFLVWQRNPSVGDLADWQANFGTSTPALSATSTVPEPTSLLLLIGASVLCSCCRRGVTR